MIYIYTNTSKIEWRQCKRKNRYRDMHAVNQYKKMCERSRGKKRDFYWCDICNGYHLTSLEATEENGYKLRMAD